MDLLNINKDQLEQAGKNFVDVESNVYSLKCKDGQTTKGFIKFCPYFNEDETLGALEKVVCHITLENRSKTDSVYFNLSQDTSAGYNFTHTLFGIKERLKNAGDDGALTIKIMRYSVAQVLEDSSQPAMKNKIVVFRFNQTLKKIMNEATAKKVSSLYEVNSKVLELLLKPITKRIGSKEAVVPTYDLCSITEDKMSIVTKEGTNYADATESERAEVSKDIMEASRYLREITDAYSFEKNTDNIIRLEYMLREYGINVKFPVNRPAEQSAESNDTTSEVKTEVKTEVKPTATEQKKVTVKEQEPAEDPFDRLNSGSTSQFSSSKSSGFAEVEDIF